MASECGPEDEEKERLMETGRQLNEVFRPSSDGDSVALEQIRRQIAAEGLNSTEVLERMREQVKLNSSISCLNEC